MTAGVMTKFRIRELSGVDRPAQTGAKVTFIKRDFSDKERQRLADTGAALPDGSFPIENEEDLHNAIRLVGRASDGAKAKAHIIARAKAMGSTGALPDGWVTKEDTTMLFDATIKKALGLADTAADTEVANALVAKSNSSETALATAVRKASMSDAEKAHCANMSDGDADDFMKKPKDQRDAAMKKAAEGDETLISAGVTVRKSVVGEGVFTILKAQAAQLEANTREIAKARDDAANATFAKRAVEEFPYVAGTVEERAAILKGIEAMTDPMAKASAEKALVAANAMAKAGFSRVGTGSGPMPEGAAATDAVGKLDKAAKDYQKANAGVTFAKAYDAVVKEHPELYEAYRAEQRARQPAASAPN